MPAQPPPAKMVGQSSFVDFGENDRDLSFAVIFDEPSVFVCDCDRATAIALACTVGIWIVIGQIQNVKTDEVSV